MIGPVPGHSGMQVSRLDDRCRRHRARRLHGSRRGHGGIDRGGCPLDRRGRAGHSLGRDLLDPSGRRAHRPCRTLDRRPCLTLGALHRLAGRRRCLAHRLACGAPSLARNLANRLARRRALAGALPACCRTTLAACAAAPSRLSRLLSRCHLLSPDISDANFRSRERDPRPQARTRPRDCQSEKFGGAEGDRTLDLCIANAALSQLSYRPTTRAGIVKTRCPSSKQTGRRRRLPPVHRVTLSQ